MKTNKALKFDSQKEPLDLLPYEAIQEIAKVLQAGAVKYSRGNWSGGINYSRCLSAALRHIHQFNSGQDRDEETSTIHLANAICNLMFVLYYMENNMTEFDDRWAIQAKKLRKQRTKKK